MLLHRSRDRLWSVAEIGAELALTLEEAASILESLASDNFLDVRISSDLLYRFDPATLALETITEKLADSYRRKPTELMKMLKRSVRDRAAPRDQR